MKDNERTVLNPHNWEEDYLGVLSDLVHGAPTKEGRNGNTRHRWGRQVRHDMRAGFPLLTSKKVWYKGAFVELLWILNGRTDLKYLHKHKVHYWDLNYEQSGRTDGTLGPVYGHQMRNFFGKDQLLTIVKGMQENPNGRRHLLSLWNPYDMEQMALPPCWYSVQFNIEGQYMDILWNQRSADWFLGVPFDMTMMAAFLALVARGLGKTPRFVVGNFADTHLYEVHLDAAKEQLSRKNDLYRLPDISIKRPIELCCGDLLIPTIDDFTIVGYESHPAIKAELV